MLPVASLLGGGAHVGGEGVRRELLRAERGGEASQPPPGAFL